MMRALEVVGTLARDDGCAGFQNSLVRDFYDVLGQGFALNENEVRLVERLVGAANGRAYGPFEIVAGIEHQIAQDVLREYALLAVAAFGAEGGPARAARMTPEQRRASARKAGKGGGRGRPRPRSL